MMNFSTSHILIQSAIDKTKARHKIFVEILQMSSNNMVLLKHIQLQNKILNF